MKEDKKETKMYAARRQFFAPNPHYVNQNAI